MVTGYGPEAGAALAAHPAVAGITFTGSTETGKKVMAGAGFRTRITRAPVNYIGIGFVVYTDPQARRKAPKGSTITLFVV